MALNELARSRLAELVGGRGRRILPTKRMPLVECAKCGWNIPRSRYRKTCAKCGGSMPPKPPFLCRLCDEPCPGRRLSWCSDECFDAYSLATDSAMLRRWTFERDKGICAACGLDCMALRKAAECMSERYGSLEWAKARTAAMRGILRDNGFNAPWHGTSACPSLWDADHIEPLDEGGSWELTNVQTLCQPCHKRKTAAQASRRAKQGRLIGRPTRIWTPEMVALLERL